MLFLLPRFTSWEDGLCPRRRLLATVAVVLINLLKNDVTNSGKFVHQLVVSGWGSRFDVIAFKNLCAGFKVHIVFKKYIDLFLARKNGSFTEMDQFLKLEQFFLQKKV